MADGRIEIDTRINEEGFQRGLRSLQTSMANAGNKMQSVGKGITSYVTAPIAALGTAAVLAGAKFEEGMDKVAAISGATDDQLAKLTDQAKMLGETTKFSATEAAGGMEFLAMAGFKTNDILDSMPVLLDMAIAGNLGLAEAADIASNIMSGFGISAEESGHVADVLAAAASNANTNISQMGEAMKYLAPTSKVLGWSVEEASAAVMAFGDAGIQGGAAGQAFSSSMSRLAKPTKRMKNMMEDLKLEFFNAEGNMKTMPEVIGMLESKMSNMTGEQKASTLATLFGAEAFKHWAVLVDKGSDALQKNVEMLETADGTSAKMAKTMADNAKGDFKAFLSALESVAITIYEKLQPSIRDLLQFITGLTRKFNELSPNAIKIALLIAGIAAAIGPALIVAGMLINAIGAIAGVFALVSGPVLAIVAGIGLFVAALVTAYAKSETFRNTVHNIFNSIKEVAITVFEVVSAFIMEKVNLIKEFWAEHGTQILEAVTNVFNGIKAAIEFVMPAIQFIIEFVWGAIKNVISGALDIIMGLVKVFTGLFTADWELLWEGVKQLFKGAIELILGLMNLSFLGGIKKILVNLAKAAGTTIKNMVGAIINFFKSLYTGAVKVVNNMVTGVIKFFTNMASNARNIFNTMRTFGASIFESIKTAIVNAIKNAASGVKTNITSMASNVKNTFQGIWQSAKDKFNAIKDAIMKPIETAVSKVTGFIDKIKNAFRNMKVKIPMPHFDFSVSNKKIAGINVPIPKVSVDWYAKGGLFPANSPRLVGIGDNTQYKEAALPLSPQVLGMIGQKIANTMPSGGSNNLTIQPTPIILDGIEIGKVDFDLIEAGLGTKLNVRMRTMGVR